MANIKCTNHAAFCLAGKPWDYGGCRVRMAKSEKRLLHLYLNERKNHDY